MPKTLKAGSKKRSSKAKKSGSGRPSHLKKSSGTRRALVRKTRAKSTGGETYVFKCTRPDCGYRIVREEKFETGKVRFDLKCPKCHNREFRCLGTGDLPETFELALTPSTIDFDSINPIDLGSK